MESAFLICSAVYLLIILALSLYAGRQVKNEEDFIVAGRRLNVPLASVTLLATWFGAGTMLTASDEVFSTGLRVTALEPFGAGICLWIAGRYLAMPLWKHKPLTLADFYRSRFGVVAEKLSVWLTVPGFIGWIAVQLAAAAGIIGLYLHLSPWICVLIITAIATVYTLSGGMWSVTLTDAFQMVIVVIGLFALSYTVLHQIEGVHWLGEWSLAMAMVPPAKKQMVPNELSQMLPWLNLWVVGALGNLPGQDLAQRILCAKSPRVAQKACYISSLAYVVLGAIPIFLALSATLVFPDTFTQPIIPALAQRFLSTTSPLPTRP